MEFHAKRIGSDILNIPKDTLLRREEGKGMEFIKARGKAIVTESDREILLQGVGLGGWLLPEGYMWKLYNDCDRPRRMEELIQSQCSEEFSRSFWNRYLEEYITERDVELISQWGFNCVRLPMNARTLCRRTEGRMEFIPEAAGRMDQLIEWCRSRKVYVILDMHGAPGGQTGTNIDDCERDQPELFMDARYQKELIELWEMLAIRYAAEPCIAGYDLLNEPLPQWFCQYNKEVLPLYGTLIRAIRNHDKKHMIILEGVHWATDFSIFEPLREGLLDDNLMLQFHKYWSNPDRESIREYLDWREQLNVPLLMGEGGENNKDWYYGLFHLLRQERISYCFWSYKKMETENSLISFRKPEHWDRIVKALKDGETLEAKEALPIWEDFLLAVSDCRSHNEVANAILGRAPMNIPAPYYSGYHIQSKRIPGAILREQDPVTILYQSDEKKMGIPDFKRYGGEEQPEQERLFVRLEEGDSVWYEIESGRKPYMVSILCRSGKNQGLAVTITDRNASFRRELQPEEYFMELPVLSEELSEGPVRILVMSGGTVDIIAIRVQE